MINKTQIKIKLLQLDKKQSDLLPELRSRGFTIGAQELSSFITGRTLGPKHDAVLENVADILCKWEKKANEGKEE